MATLAPESIGLTIQPGGAVQLLDVARPDFPWAFCAGADITAHAAPEELHMHNADDVNVPAMSTASPAAATLRVHSELVAEAERRGVLLDQGAPSFVLGRISAPSVLISWDKLMAAGVSVFRGALPVPLRPPSTPPLSRRCDNTGQYTFQAPPSGAGRLTNGPLPWIGPGITAAHEPHARAALPSVPDLIHPNGPTAKGGALGRARVVVWDISCGREAFPIPVVVDGGFDVPPGFLRRLLLASVHYTPSYIGKDNVTPPAHPQNQGGMEEPTHSSAAPSSAAALQGEPECLLSSPGRKRFEPPAPEAAGAEGGEGDPQPVLQLSMEGTDSEEEEEIVAPLIDMSQWHTLKALSATLSGMPEQRAEQLEHGIGAQRPNTAPPKASSSAPAAPDTPPPSSVPPPACGSAGASSSSLSPESTADEPAPPRTHTVHRYVEKYLACSQVFTHFLARGDSVLQCPPQLPAMPQVQAEFASHQWQEHSRWRCSCGAHVRTAVLPMGGDFSMFRCSDDAPKAHLEHRSTMDSVSFMLCPCCACTPAWECPRCIADSTTGAHVSVPHNLSCCVACGSSQPLCMPWQTQGTDAPSAVRCVPTIEWSPCDPSPYAPPPGSQLAAQLNEQLLTARSQDGSSYDVPAMPSLPAMPPKSTAQAGDEDALAAEAQLLQSCMHRLASPQTKRNGTKFTLPVSDPARIEKRSPPGYVYELHQDCIVGVDSQAMLAVLGGQGCEGGAVVPPRHRQQQMRLLRGMTERMDLRYLPMQPLPLQACTPRPYFVEDWLPAAAGSSASAGRGGAPAAAEESLAAPPPGSPQLASCPSQHEMLAMLRRYAPALRWAGILGAQGAVLPRYAADGSMQWAVPSPVATAMVDALRSGNAGLSFMFGGWIDSLPAATPSPPVPRLKPKTQRIRDGVIAAALAWSGNAVAHPGAGLERGLRFPLPPASSRPSATPTQTLHLPFVSDGVHLLTSPVVECPVDCVCHSCEAAAAGTPPAHRNDVVQRGIRLPLEVFWTGFGAKGWGVRCRCAIPKGTFVAVYAGLVTPNPSACVAYVVDLDTPQLYHESCRVDRPPYKASLEEGWSASRELRGCDAMQRAMAAIASGTQAQAEEPADLPPSPLEAGPAELPVVDGGDPTGVADSARAEMMRAYYDHNKLCVDASVYCNISRFFNHSCKPNMNAVPVYFSPNADLRRPALALFASEQIPAYTELTWHYVHGYGQGDDSVQYKDADGKDVQRCLCDENVCRDKLRLHRFWRRTASGREDLMHLSPQEVDQRVAAERRGEVQRPKLPCSAAPIARQSAVVGGGSKRQRGGGAAKGARAGKAARQAVSPSSPPSDSPPPSSTDSSSDEGAFSLPLPRTSAAASASAPRQRPQEATLSPTAHSSSVPGASATAHASTEAVQGAVGGGATRSHEPAWEALQALIDLTSSDEEDDDTSFEEVA